MSTTDILSQLSTLTPAQQKEAMARLKLLLANDNGTDSQDESIIYDEISNVLKDLGDRNIPPIFAVKKSNYYKAYVDGIAAFLSYIDTYLAPNTKVDRLVCIRAMLKVLILHMKSGNNPIPILFATVANNLKNVDMAVESNFPGYRESGLLKVLLDKESI